MTKKYILLQSDPKCGNHEDSPVIFVLWEGQPFRLHLQGGLQTFQTGQSAKTVCYTHTHVCVCACVCLLPSCSQVRLTDSLGLLAKILETEGFALVVQEPAQSNTLLSVVLHK